MGTSESLAGLCIVGTDTDVGKTFLTARIARQMRNSGVNVGIYKPACSGGEETSTGDIRWHDIETQFAALEEQHPRERICPQRFVPPLAPPVAADAEGKHIDDTLLVSGIEYWQDAVDILLIEGVGGLLCPLSESQTVCDFAVSLGFPVLIVSRLGLGTINHTLLTVEIAEQRGLSVVGIVLNEAEPGQGGLAGETNAREIAKRCRVPILATVRYRESGGLRPLSETSTIAWEGLAKPGK